MHVCGERNCAVSLKNFGLNLAKASGFTDGGSRDAHKLAACLVKSDNLLNASLNVSRFLGDHALNEDRMIAPHPNIAKADGASASARVVDLQAHADFILLRQVIPITLQVCIPESLRIHSADLACASENHPLMLNPPTKMKLLGVR
jgi:hypothetical protein